ncbi:MAG: hypothetical protein HOP33_20580 [Verrucomicrobia bacterium]|nr:hypothetical protein [Verrucomicrobiota bacterium]
MRKLYRIAGLMGLLPMIAIGAHHHCIISAPQITAGIPLTFNNDYAFAAETSGFVLTLDYNTNTYAGYYITAGILNNVAFTSEGDESITHPVDGTQVRVRFVAVSGPPGGSFGVWDVAGFGNGNNSTTLTFSLPVGTTNGNNSVLVSENSGEPFADPYGHIHGRQFSATKPGLYLLTVQAYDASHNGAGGGPLHTPTSLLSIYFQAGPAISAITHSTNEVAISFPSQVGKDYYLEASANLSDTNSWQTISGPVSGNDSFQVFTDLNWSADQQFYRVRVTTP